MEDCAGAKEVILLEGSVHWGQGKRRWEGELDPSWEGHCLPDQGVGTVPFDLLGATEGLEGR